MFQMQFYTRLHLIRIGWADSMVNADTGTHANECWTLFKFCVPEYVLLYLLKWLPSYFHIPFLMVFDVTHYHVSCVSSRQRN